MNGEWSAAGEALAIGSAVRVTEGNTATERAHTLSGRYGRVTHTSGRMVTARFPGTSTGSTGYTVATFDVDWLVPVVYVRAEFYGPGMMPNRSEFSGARIVVRERFTPRRQRTYPYAYGATDARSDAVSTFARDVLGMMVPEVSEAYARGRVTMFAVVDTGTCDCTDEYGPCEHHGETMVSREGSSLRTADELGHEFLTDAVSVLGAYPSPEFESATIRLGNALADNRSTYGTAWFPDGDGNADDYRDESEHWQNVAEAALSAAGYSVFWADGYRIVRITGGPMTDA